jgi:hypothetical protein
VRSRLVLAVALALPEAEVVADFLVAVPRAEEEGEEALVSISFPKRGSAVADFPAVEHPAADFLETQAVGFLGALAPIAQELKRSR